MKKRCTSLSFLILVISTASLVAQDTIRDIPYGIGVEEFIENLDVINGETVRWDTIAFWNILWVDGTYRSNLKNGDILQFQNYDFATKEYYLELDEYLPDYDAHLASIIWPDIPDSLMQLRGWPNGICSSFAPKKYAYEISLPPGYSDMPVLSAITNDVNATFEVSVEETLVNITVVSEDSSETLEYTVRVQYQQDPEKQPYFDSEPFLSELVFRAQYQNSFIEIYNPTNRELDLSDYMIVCNYDSASPEGALRSFTEMDRDSWDFRYRKYIPGYKWEEYIDWKNAPAIAIQDPLVNSKVKANDVFVLGYIQQITDNPEWGGSECDIDFKNNPWGEDIDHSETCVIPWMSFDIFIFKILNDSIKLGLKPANDPLDFKLVETFGTEDQSDWIIGGETADQVTAYIRKPEYYLPKDEYGESWGTTTENSEWYWQSENDLKEAGVDWPDFRELVSMNIGEHSINPITIYSSMVSSNYYRITKGYSGNEMISGLEAGTVVEDFLSNIIKADNGQALSIIQSSSGDMLSGQDPIEQGDSLLVISADGANRNKYFLDISDIHLSDNAALSSETYTITISGNQGTISGIEHGSSLSEILRQIQVPADAQITLLNSAKQPRPFKVLKNEVNGFEESIASEQFCLNVIAENKLDTIQYELDIQSQPSEFGLYSDYFYIYHEVPLISILPYGITVRSFMNRILYSHGVEAFIVDRLGEVREEGMMAFNDCLKLISADGQDSISYFLNFVKETDPEQNYLIVTDAGPDIEVCNGESIRLSIDSPYDVQWSHNVVNDWLFTPAATQDYYLTISNLYYTFKDTITVTVHDYPDAFAGDDQRICGPHTILSGNEVEGALMQWKVIYGDASLHNADTSYTEVDLAWGLNRFSYELTKNNCTTVDHIDVLNENIDMTITFDTYPLPCPGEATGSITTTVSGGNPPYSYSWPNGETGDGIDSLPAGEYTLKVVDSKGCLIEKTTRIDETSPHAEQELCMVSAINDVNVVNWDDPGDQGIKQFNIYTESDFAGQYTLIGTVPYGEETVFEDLDSKPRTRSYRYKISCIDTCGNESELSGYHQTMLLSISVGLKAFNLIWNDYELESGEIVCLKYYILRGNTLETLEIIDSISASNNFYVDNNPPDGPLFYQIAGVKDGSCAAGGIKSSTAYSLIYSNVIDNGKNVLEPNSECKISVYPNPVISSTRIVLDQVMPGKTILNICSLSGRIVHSSDITNRSEVIFKKDDLKPGLYFIEIIGVERYRKKIHIL